MANTDRKATKITLDVASIPEPFKYVGKEVCADVPRVSIIIPAFNVAEYIVETLESVFKQSYKDYEVLLINDGSTDTELLEKVIEPYKERLTYLKIDNLGVGPARNIAIMHSRGELLAFLDGDDIWTPGFLVSQTAFLDKNNYDLVYSDALIFGDSFMNGRLFTQDAPSEGEANFESLLDLRCNVVLSSTLARKEAVLKVGMFEWKKVRAQDFNLWLRMAQAGARIGYQKESLVRYRMRKSSLSGDAVMRIDREINAYRRVGENIELNDSAKRIVEKQVTRLRAEREIMLGKAFLLSGNYQAATEAFKKGNAYRKSHKLNAIILMLRFAPNILTKIYQNRRQGEIEYMPDTAKLQK